MEGQRSSVRSSATNSEYTTAASQPHPQPPLPPLNRGVRLNMAQVKVGGCPSPSLNAFGVLSAEDSRTSHPHSRPSTEGTPRRQEVGPQELEGYKCYSGRGRPLPYRSCGFMTTHASSRYGLRFRFSLSFRLSHHGRQQPLTELRFHLPALRHSSGGSSSGSSRRTNHRGR